jgi:small-conductance mechanosensitive channel
VVVDDGSRSADDAVEEDDPSILATLGNAISANFRRAVFAAVVACCGLAASIASGGVLGSGNAPVRYLREHSWLAGPAAGLGAATFFIFGLIGVRSATKEILKTVPDRLGDNRKNGLRWICLLVGYLLVIFGTLGGLNVPIERLLVGGAVTGVILGIAAQQSLGNLFAGLVLLLVRPFSMGDEISLRSGALGGVLTGQVADMNLTYVQLITARGPILLPNSTILTAAVGPPGVFDPLTATSAMAAASAPPPQPPLAPPA